MDILGYILAIVMGLVLGLLGGGGSILTVPILVYFFGISATVSTGYSLLVVGLTSLVGAVKYYKEKLINMRVVFLFALPSMAGVLVARKYLLPALPDVVSIAAFHIPKDQIIMLTFAFLVLAISIFMLKAKDKDESNKKVGLSKYNRMILISIEGFLVGCITGFVGAGGGFMIVPALILLANVPLREAIATSLVIIALKSLAGFVGDLSEGVYFDWVFLSVFIGFTMLGVVLGTMLNKKINCIAILKLVYNSWPFRK